MTLSDIDVIEKTTPGAGEVQKSVAGDTIATLFWQYVGMAFGPHGTKTPVDANNPLPVAAFMTSGGNTQAVTPASGTGFTAFPNLPCKSLMIVNDTGQDLEYRQDGAGVAVPIFDRDRDYIGGITNASQIAVRRKDVASELTVKARWEG